MFIPKLDGLVWECDVRGEGLKSFLIKKKEKDLSNI
jgi:hypothetical protein